MQIDRLHLTATEPKEQIQQIRSYLFKLAEQLETILDTIDEQNFTAALIKRLDGMETDIKTVQHVVMETDPGVGAAVNYADGTIILVKET